MLQLDFHKSSSFSLRNPNCADSFFSGGRRRVLFAAAGVVLLEDGGCSSWSTATGYSRVSVRSFFPEFDRSSSVVYEVTASLRSEISRVKDLSPLAPLVVSGGGAWVRRWSDCVSTSRLSQWQRVVSVAARGGSAWFVRWRVVVACVTGGANFALLTSYSGIPEWVTRFASSPVDGHEGSGLKTAFFGSASRTTASSRGHFLSCRRGCICLVFLVGPCFDSSSRSVLGWVSEAAGSVASRFEGAYLSARGNCLFFSDLPARFGLCPIRCLAGC
ncbi:unnamed protein product [Eruca vesicaria subsp. sativa]|uniref:Uncharacterized protein n=1 Tax=Eruca vesicaria subsp. sativa TaxID=29727 RepID=A0ABC8JUS5_ERUVS|nr:unnamed protein product [Eruca vesicaria subsp. sativa]